VRWGRSCIAGSRDCGIINFFLAIAGRDERRSWTRSSIFEQNLRRDLAHAQRRFTARLGA
jgi:hypothetical protein